MSLVLNKFYSGVGPPGNLGLHVNYIFDASEGASGVYRPMTPADFGGTAAEAIVPSSQGGLTGIGSIFAANEDRNQLFIQNVGVNPIFIALSGVASPTNYNMILAAGEAAEDGKGGSWSADNWTGPVSISGSGIAYTRFEY